MSDVSDIEARGQRQHDLDALSGDEGSDSYDTRAQRYSSDEESEDDDNDDELRREGFLVDDDDEEESETESEKRRRRRRKKKRRHQAEQAAAREEQLDEEDLALVAENTYGVREAQPRLKRLKRGRRAVDEDEDEPRAEAGRVGGGSFGSDEFGSDEFDNGGFGTDAFAGGSFEGDYGAERRGGRAGREGELERGVGEEVAQRHGRTGAMASFLAEGLESIDDETWMELQDIFGSGEEYAFAMEAPAAAAAAGERTLAEVFEPAELEAKMMTQRDEEIRATDIPERMQMRAAAGEALRALSEEEIEEETTWVMRQLHARAGRGEEAEAFRQADFGNERFLAAVLSVLKLLSQEFYEVPFIAQHRREAFVTAEGAAEGEEAPTREWLSGEDLWRLYDYDQQFRGFLAARRRVQNTVRRLRGEGGAARAISSEDEAYAGELLATAGGVEEVADVGEWLQARYGEAMRGSAYARAGGAGFWAQARRTGAAAFAGRFGITARQVGDNVSAPGRHAVRDDAAAPLDAARALVGAALASPEAALRAAGAAWAQAVALDPQVRRFVRAYCGEHACVVARATAKGVREITHGEHAAYAVKFVRQKPVGAFAGGAQFLELQRAADAGLVRMQFSLSGEYRFDNGDLRRDAAEFAADRERSAQAVAALLAAHARSGDAAWDAVRRDALAAAARDALLPHMWRETAQRLHAQAAAAVADACRRSLARRIDVQAARPRGLAPGARPRVLVVAGGGFAASARGALRAVLVDARGAVAAARSADSVRPGSAGAAMLRELLARGADVAGVSGMGMQARRLLGDVQAAVDAHCAQAGGDVLVTFASDEAARLWSDGAAARAELPALARAERYCVGVARALQDPTAAYAALGADVLLLPLHAAQRCVDARALRAVVERAFVDVVNRVGVDVNAPHARALLPFVSGLGPRKAHALAARVGARALDARSDLVVRRLCTRTVFVNCASFLRVRAAADVLDDTRVHPEDYDLARKMALDALDIEDDDDDARRRRRDGPSRHVADLMRRAPDKLDELDLARYAAELARLLGVHKLETLKFIRRELQRPHADPRAPFAPPDAARVLHMLTGETVGASLRDDGSCLVAGTVVRVQPRFAVVQLDSGLEGFVGVASIADHRVEAASDELAPGQPVAAVVTRIDLERLSVDLSLRRSDIAAACALADAAPAADAYFDADAEARLRERARARQHASAARTRHIPHPLFKPLGARDAEHYLAARPRGDCVIRPSSRGPDHIAVTWKVADGLFQHIDVREENKPHAAALGASFSVGDLSYSDLDELVALHVDPIARKLDDVRRSAKFYDPEADPLYRAEPALGPDDGSRDFRARRLARWDARVARHLDTLAQSTGRGAYCVALSLARPGALVLAFKPTPDARGFKQWVARVEPN
ncbi:Transcription elongation factor spt6, partial [Coemansia sp. RSA 2708]